MKPYWVLIIRDKYRILKLSPLRVWCLQVYVNISHLAVSSTLLALREKHIFFHFFLKEKLTIMLYLEGQFFFFEIEPHVVQVSLEHTTYMRITKNVCSSCLHFSHVGIIDVQHQAWLYEVLGINIGIHAPKAGTLAASELLLQHKDATQLTTNWLQIPCLQKKIDSKVNSGM